MSIKIHSLFIIRKLCLTVGLISSLLYAEVISAPQKVLESGRAGNPKVVQVGQPKIKSAGVLYNFTNYSIENGLQSQVIAQYEDSRGYMWFGTGDGIYRYDGKEFVNFSLREGLRGWSVWTITEDQSGNLWFGTLGGGVYKYDGKSLTHYTTEEGLSDNNIFSILEDLNGILWFGTKNGADRYDGKRADHPCNNKTCKHNLRVRQHLEEHNREVAKSFTRFTTEQGLANNHVWSITADKRGNLWFGTIGGVSHYDGSSFTSFTTEQGLSNNNVRSITEDRAGNLWFGTQGGGVNRYDGKSFTKFTTAEGLSDNNIYSILEDQDGNLWFGTKQGVNKYDGESITIITIREGLSNNIVYSLLEDRTGTLWFGTYGGGVDKYNGDMFTYFTNSEGLSNKLVVSISEDRSGNLWFGTQEGGINKYDGKSFTHFTTDEGLSSNEVWAIAEDHAGNMWFGTKGGLTKYDGKSFTHFTTSEGLSNNAVTVITEDQEKDIWVGTQGGLNRYDGSSFTHITIKDGLGSDAILTILEDQSGNLWLGTFEGGATKYDGESFVHFTAEKECPENDENCVKGLPFNVVSSLLEDNSGNIWMGTYGGGLGVLINNKEVENRQKGGQNTINNYEWIYINTENGLNSNSVVSMILDNEGNVWAGTNRGIAKIEAADYQVRSYGKLEGFRGIECNTNAAFKDRAGNLWFGTANLLTKCNPELNRINDVEPQTYITGIKLFLKETDWLDNRRTPMSDNDATESQRDIRHGNKESPSEQLASIKYDGLSMWHHLPINLSLPYDQNHITFQFNGISLKIPEKVRYTWILEGYDKAWSPSSEKREFTYPNLPPGEYTFKVKACNDENVWNQQAATYSFVVIPPFWQTAWFYVICALAGVGIIYLFINKSIIRHLNEEEKRIVKNILARIIKGKNAIFVKCSTGIIGIKLHHILWIKPCKPNYISIKTSNDKIETRLTLDAIEKMLPSKDFIRVHKSYIIRIDKIASIPGNFLRFTDSDEEIPIGKNYKEVLYSRLTLINKDLTKPS